MGLFRSITQSAQSAKVATRDRVVGIDVGTSAIKVVELQDRNGVVTLTTYGELQLGPYAEKQIGQPTQLTPALERQALVDVIRESAVKASQAVLAMPLSASFVTVISLTADEKDDIESRVRVEARKYIPVPMADVALDWAEIEVGAGAAAGTRDVLVAAIQNDALTRFANLMKTVEFQNPPTEIECFSTIRSAYKEGVEQSVILDVGAQSSKLYIIRKGLLQRMHRVPHAGAAMTERIMAETGETFEVVEAKKRTMTTTDPAFVAYQKVVQTTFGRVLREFAQVVEEYEAKSGLNHEHVYLSGGATLFPSFDALVSTTLSRSVSYLQPFDKVAYPAFMEDTLRVIGPTFAPALGAALRHFE